MDSSMADASWDATLTLLRWRQTRRGYDGDDALLATAFELLASDERGAFGPNSRLRLAEKKCNVPAERIATELIHLALLLITKPRREESCTNVGVQSRAVLKLLHLGLKALRGTAPASDNSASLAIPMNACNLLLSAMADTLVSVHDQTDASDNAIGDVLQIFVFLFGMSTSDVTNFATPSFNMYKPPTNVFSAFMQRACTAVFAQLGASSSTQQTTLVKLVLAIMRVFQELQFSQVNKKKVFVAIAKTSFREIVGYRHALLMHTEKVKGVVEVLDVLDRVIVDALFDSEHLRAYDGALVNIHMWRQNKTTSAIEENGEETTTHKHKKQRRKQTDKSESSLVSYQRHLFDELKAFLSDANVQEDAKESIGSLLELLVRGFATRIRAAANEKIEDTRSDLKSSKKRVASVIATTSTAYSPFKFWAELCGVVFTAFESAEQTHNDAAVAMLVSVYDALFRALCASDVYRVTEDTEDQEQFYMMETILTRFVKLVRVETTLTSPSRRRVCSVVSHAVQCTPNLVHSSLESIFYVLGACSCEVDAASAAMGELLHAYESMRLVDAFLKACCADPDDAAISVGLLTIFAHPTTEATLRRTYMTLPPGQLEIVWRLLTDTLAVLCGSKHHQAVASKMALVRSLFALFLQEIHITPQNRLKIGELVIDSHEKLLATLSSRVARFSTTTKDKKGSNRAGFSIVDRELFSVFGELLALYDGLSPVVRSETLDVVLASLETKLTPVMTSLLTGSDEQIVGAAAGIVKIGVHHLRRQTDRSNGHDVASLMVDRVIQWRCWDAVAFYLPELVSDLEEEKAATLYVELIASLLGDERARDAAQRILGDAAFYEITALQRVAAQVFTTVISRTEFVTKDAMVRRLFDHLLTVPEGYINVAHPSSGELLMAVLRVHQSIAMRTNATEITTLASIALWIERHLVAIASANNVASVCKRIALWTEFLLLDANTVDGSSARLVRVAIEYLTSLSTSETAETKTMDTALTQLLAQKTARGYATSATVLEAVASIQATHKASAIAHASITQFVDSLITTIETTPRIIATLESDTSFHLLTALVRYTASLSDTASVRRTKLVTLLETHLSHALAVVMQTIVQAPTLTERGSRYQFFATFCETFYFLRPTVTLETFGCLLATALVLATEEGEKNDAPLACLVQYANKDEFQLVVTTLQRELRVPITDRVVAALKALAFVLETDKKLASSRRQELSDNKTAFLGLFVQLFSRALNHHASPSLCVWNLRVFVLFYCKAELFTWKPYELLQVFVGFQPLTVLAAQTNNAAAMWTPRQIHHVWLLSYNLLLRIVRHHFASLINGLPLMVDALNTLLRVLVAASSRSDMTVYTLEWSANLARLYGYLKPQDAALRKHVVYLLLTYLHGVTQGKLTLALQLKLRPGVFALLEMCSLFEKEQLYASLDTAGKSLLKSLDTSYKLTYRYAGKV